VFFEWTVEEHWSRTVIETYTDANGKPQTRTRHESGWTRVADGRESEPFYLQDDCGVVLVCPEGAKLEPATIFDETCGRDDPLYYGKGPDRAVANSDQRRRFVERAIRLHAPLYVVGQARERADVVAPEIAQDAAAPLFLISTRTEEQVESGFKWGGRGWDLLGLVLWVAGFVVRGEALGNPMENRLPLYFLVGGGYLILSALVWAWMVYNSLVDVRQRVRQAWAQVDVQLKRRHDLIPNLVRR
jgi:hypothetical protein